MFKSDKFYIIVRNKSFVVKKEGDESENIIELQSFVPNVPAYHHLFDEDKKNYIEDLRKQIKRLKIKKALIIFPDDAMDIEADKRLLSEFFLQCGVKKVHIIFQCLLLNLENKKYISASRTTRTLVVQYISYNKSISKKYYDKGYMDMDKILLDMKHLHADCEYDMIPVYVNNINEDMEEFRAIGSLVSLHDIITNIMKTRLNN